MLLLSLLSLKEPVIKHNPVSVTEWAINWLKNQIKLSQWGHQKGHRSWDFCQIVSEEEVEDGEDGWGDLQPPLWTAGADLGLAWEHVQVGWLPLQVILKSLCLLNQCKTIISVPFQCFQKIWPFITGLTAEIATSVSLVTLVWAGTMCELLNKPFRRGGNQGSAGQTGGELQGNTEMFFESLDLTIFPLSKQEFSSLSRKWSIWTGKKC